MRVFYCSINKRCEHFTTQGGLLSMEIRKKATIEEQLNYIMECRQSGLTVYQWCDKHDIKPSSYYNWVHRLKLKGYTLPDIDSKEIKAIPTQNEIVKVDILPEFSTPELLNYNYNEQQNTRINNNSIIESQPHAEILINGATIKFYNKSDAIIIDSIIKSIGGLDYDR